MKKIDWSMERGRMMLDPSIINLNTGSFGPLPQAVFDRVTELRRELAAEPTHFLVRTMPPLLWRSRVRLAEFLGTQPQRLVLTVNVSAAINLIASTLKLASPGEVLLTDHEYGAMHWCWQRACQQQGLTLRTFPLPTMATNPGQILEAAEKALTPRTRLFFFSHVFSPTGLVVPAKELCALARRKGIITVVDGAHAPAMLPLNVNEVDADFYCGNCHKWLLAPTNAGFFVLGRGSEDRLLPLHVSWGYYPDRMKLDEPDEFGSTPRVRFLEFEGTRDPCPWISVEEAIAYQTAIGWDEIRGRIEVLSQYVRRRFRETVSLPEATPPQAGLHGALTAFQLPFAGAENAKRLRERIWRHRIEIPIVERPDRLLIRASTHFYNTEEEINRLVEILPAALAMN